MPIRLFFLAVALLPSLYAAEASATPVDRIEGFAPGESLILQPLAINAMASADLSLPSSSLTVVPPDLRETSPASTGAGIAAAVPEPGIAALMALGFAGIGWITRRRQRNDPAGSAPLDDSVERSGGDGATKNAAVRAAPDRPT